MIAVGIDVGSVSSKGVIFDGQDWDFVVLPTGWSPKEIGRVVFDTLCQRRNLSEREVDKIIGTGYGRIHLPFAHKIASEIACHGLGSRYLFPHAIGVIDVGGQDSKAMLLNERGKVMDFVLNDKCAAGTGRFLQVTTQALGVDLSEIDELAADAEPLAIGSMCTVFAETEVLNLLVQGRDKAEIVSGILKSIAKKVVAMAGRISIEGEIVFTGGLAKSAVLKNMLADLSGWNIRTAADPQITGALGAAVMGYEILKRELEK
jgi:predicted CoA-substrate-specific enzyme activase